MAKKSATKAGDKSPAPPTEGGNDAGERGAGGVGGSPPTKEIVKVSEKRLRKVAETSAIPKTTASHVGIITRFTRISDSTKVNIVNIMKGFIKEEVLKSVSKMQDNRTTLMERDI